MYKIYCIRILFFLLLVCTSNKAGALVRYVKPVASGTASGLSWTNASSDLQGMINASTSGDEVWVAAGTYLPTEDKNGNKSPTDPRTKTFHLKAGVNLYGGFTGNETSLSARNISANRTILSGNIGTQSSQYDNCHQVVYLYISGSNTTGCIIDGFTIQGGYNDDSYNGGGISAYGGKGNIFRNLHVRHNYAIANGGGIFVDSGEYMIKCDSIYDNHSNWYGGGVSTGAAVTLIDSNAIYSNTADRGGGIYNRGKIILNRNAIYNNISGNRNDISLGGGVFLSGPDTNKVTNNSIYGNTTTSSYSGSIGGGIYITGDTTSVYIISNNQMFSNLAQDAGGAVYVYYARYCNFVNNTFYNNAATQVLSSNPPAGGAIFNNNVPSQYTNNIFWKNCKTFMWATWVQDDVNNYNFDTSRVKNNIFQRYSNIPGNKYVVDPLFVNENKPLGADSIAGTSDDGLMLKLCSPAVNAGIMSTVSGLDILGKPRIANYDIGAFEYPGDGPVISSAIQGEDIICLNTNSAYTNTVSGGVWKVSDTSIAKISQTGVVTATGIGSANITYTSDTTGCPGTIVSKKIVVTVFTPVNPIAGADSVCTKGTIQLSNSTQGGVWYSSDTSIAVVSNGGVVTAKDTGVVIITYKTGGIGCADSATKTVTVGLTPAATPISGNTTEYLCITDTVLFTNATPGGIWSTKSGGTIANVSSSGLLIPINPGTDSLKYTITTPFGCVQQVKKRVSITVPSPLINDSISGSDSLCIGDTIHLSHTWQPFLWENLTSWKSDNPAVATIKRLGKGTAVVTGISAGTAVMTYTVRDGNCTILISKMITVVGPPTVAAITGANIVCRNSTMYVTNTTPGGVWKVLDPTPVFSVDTSGLIIPQKLGMGTVSYIIANHMGCADTIHKQISVAKEPTRLPINGPDSICSQEETLLTNVWTGYWFSSDTLTATVDSGGVVKGIGAGMATINYRVINSSGCTSVIDKNIFVKELPKVWPIVGSAIVCKNSTQQYTNVTKGGVWSTWSVNIISSISQSGLLQAYSRGTDTVFYTVTNELGCSTVVHSPISVNVPESIPITGSEKACTGYSEQFAHAVTDGKWSVYKKTAAKISGSGVYLSKTAGTDSVFYEYRSNSCPIQVRKAVMVNRTPDTAVIYGEKMVCKFESLQLSSTFSDGAWASTDNAIALIDQQGLVYGKDAGIAVLNYIRVSSAGCSSSAVYQIQVSKPNADVEQDGTQLQVMSRLHGIGYQWVDCDNNYQAIPGATESYYEALKNGKYAVVVTYKGCDDTSACLSITTLGNNPTDEYPLIFPNPSSDNITINTGNKIAIEIRLFDAVGRRVGTIIPSGPVTMVSVSHLLPGIYQVQLNIDGETIIRKLIVL